MTYPEVYSMISGSKGAYMFADSALKDVYFRTARMQDVPEIERLLVASVRSLNTQHYTKDEVESALRYALTLDYNVIADGTYFVGVSHGHIIAGGGWSRRDAVYGHGDGSARFLDPARDAAKIRSMYVHPAYARRGIGQRLMQMSEAAAYGKGFRELELMATLTGEHLYLKCGFKIVERIALEMPDGHVLNGVHMHKWLA
jgi:GNAT superfamily N-acetyltransferase